MIDSKYFFVFEAVRIFEFDGKAELEDDILDENEINLSQLSGNFG